MSVYGFTVTAAGEALMAQAAGSGQALVITGTQVGSGVVEDAAAARALTALISPQQAGTYSTPQINGGQFSMIVEYRNDLNGGLTSGFGLNEFGIFARVGSGQPALLAYGSLGDSPAPVHPIAGGLETYRYPVAIAFSGDLEVTVEDPSGAFVTDDQLAQYVPLSQKGQAGGVASLDEEGKIPEEQIPDLYLPLTGGTMTGHITLPGIPSGALQAIPKKYADELFMIAMGQGIVRVQVYETGTETPIPGVAITGATDFYGGTLYAGDDGVAVGLAPEATSTLQVDTRYIDLTGQTKSIVATPVQQVTEVTLYAARVSNPTTRIETYTASRQGMFTRAVEQVDVHCIGAGAGGSRGYTNDVNGRPHAKGGTGGGMGASQYRTDVSFQPDRPFDITVGLGGAGAPSRRVTSSASEIPDASGSRGGDTSCLGVTATGGPADGGAYGADAYDRNAEESGTDASPAEPRSGFLFGGSSGTAVPGGDGGGGGAWSQMQIVHDEEDIQAASEGGAPSGGDGGSTTGYNSASSGSSGSTGGGGGGGAVSNLSDNAQNGYLLIGAAGGDGGDGAVYIRWRYAA